MAYSIRLGAKHNGSGQIAYWRLTASVRKMERSPATADDYWSFELRCRHNGIHDDARFFLWDDGDEIEIMDDDDYAAAIEAIKEHEPQNWQEYVVGETDDGELLIDEAAMDAAVDKIIDKWKETHWSMKEATNICGGYPPNVQKALLERWAAIRNFLDLEYTY